MELGRASGLSRASGARWHRALSICGFFLRRHCTIRRRVAWLNAVAVVNAGAQAATAVLFGHIFTLFVSREAFNHGPFWLYVGLSTGFWAASSAMTRVEFTLTAALREYTALFVGRAVCASMMRRPVGAVRAEETALTMGRLSEDASACTELIVFSGGIAKPATLAVISFIYAAMLSPIVPLIVVVLVPFYSLFMARRHDLGSRLFFDASERSAVTGAFLHETLAGHSILVGHGASGRRIARYVLLMKVRMRSLTRAQCNAATIHSLAFSSQGLLALLVLVIGGIAIREGAADIGLIVTVNTMILYLWTSTQTLVQSVSALHKLLPNLMRLSATLAIGRRVAPPVRRIEYVARGINVRDVSLIYPGSDRAVLDHVSLTIQEGERVLVTGANGAGKTTLFNLLSGALAPTSGEISIASIAITPDWSGSLYPHVIAVAQETYLFQGSVRENILLGNPHADEATLTAALRTVQLENSPILARSAVGERGSELSGGQRQRVSVARALVCAPSVLLLDEPTASIDWESRLALYEALLSHRDRTVVIITHDPADLRSMVDRHFHVGDGTVIELPLSAKVSMASAFTKASTG